MTLTDRMSRDTLLSCMLPKSFAGPRRAARDSKVPLDRLLLEFELSVARPWLLAVDAAAMHDNALSLLRVQGIDMYAKARLESHPLSISPPSDCRDSQILLSLDSTQIPDAPGPCNQQKGKNQKRLIAALSLRRSCRHACDA
jgi:hypothetical protein